MKISYIGKCLLVEEKGKKILVVGDLHLGYEEVLNQSGVFVTRKMFDEMIGYFDKIFIKVGKLDYVVLLGDVKHDFGKVLGQEWNDVLGLFDYLKKWCKKIVVVRGNHDTILKPIVMKKTNVLLKDYYIFNGITFLHGDKDFKEILDKKIKYLIMGHGHPAVKLGDNVKVEKYKCFLVGRFKGKNVIITPSFFEYSEGSDPRENDLGLAWNFDYGKFDVKVVDSENLKVLDFGMLERL